MVEDQGCSGVLNIEPLVVEDEGCIGVAFETPLLEDVALEPNRLRDGDLDVSLLGDTSLELEDTFNDDEGLVVPNESLFEGV